MVETQKYWFAARTRDKQEFAIGKFLEKLKSNENLDIDYYLPTKMDLNPDGVSFDNEPLTIGNKVKVVKGDFRGIEGEIATEANKTYVVIRINGILTASVKVPKSYLKIIK